MTKTKCSILLILGACSWNMFAQKIAVRATLDSAVMVIGEQSKLRLQIDQMPNVRVQMPLFSDSLPGGLELVGLPKIDTARANDGLISIKHEYTVTAFDEHIYTVPQLPFVDGEDTVFSNSVSIKIVQPFVIDTLTNTFADIKSVMSPPFDWAWLAKVVLLVWLILAILVLIVILIQKFILKKSVKILSKPEVIIPPDVLAINALNEIRNEKIWQRGRVKEYHTRLTEVLREYIEKVFDFGAMEMTSDEILENLQELKTEKKPAFDALRQVLRTADLVKFAKFTPMPDENEASLSNAFEFVKETKKEEIQENQKL